MSNVDKCDADLVSGEQGVKDEALTASSSYNPGVTGPARARLNSTEGNGKAGAWSPRTNTNEWIQVKLFSAQRVLMCGDFIWRTQNNTFTYMRSLNNLKVITSLPTGGICRTENC